MKLGAIKLEASVITDLYKKNLVEPKGTDLPEKKADKPVVAIPRKKNADQPDFLGENKKNILILVNYQQSSYLPDEELGFLTNMLSACKLGLADVAIINLFKVASPSYKDFLSPLKAGTILLFGIEPSVLELPMDFPYFQVQSFTTTTFLYTPTLDEIKEDKILKSKLWVCLRKIFNL